MPARVPQVPANTPRTSWKKCSKSVRTWPVAKWISNFDGRRFDGSGGGVFVLRICWLLVKTSCPRMGQSVVSPHYTLGGGMFTLCDGFEGEFGFAMLFAV